MILSYSKNDWTWNNSEIEKNTQLKSKILVLIHEIEVASGSLICWAREREKERDRDRQRDRQTERQR